jgi:hypothetical protein
MEENIYNTFNTIFSDSPKPPKSIFLEINLDNNQKTETSDVFECLLNMFVFGLHKLNIPVNEDSFSQLKPYFESIGIKFNVEFLPFDTGLYNDPRYKYRYCSISNESSDKPNFILNANQLPKQHLHEFYATYQYHYEYLIFLSFT